MRRSAQFPREGGNSMRPEVPFSFYFTAIISLNQENEVQWLWQILDEMSPEEKSQFMMFVNGTRRFVT